ncbi:ISAs1 family transposase [Escherichia coli]|nr:ISAs1 family transposase [Escherichia coli]
MSNQHPFMHFDAIPDYRQQGKVEHKLTDIILLTICAVLSGQDDWKAIHLYGTRWLDFLKRFGDFSHGVPSAITIARVMGMISATRLQKCFIEWMKSCCELTDGEVIAIDGKTVRGSYDDSRGLGAIHMVNAFATENGVCLGQHKVYEKSNEITAIPELLQLLDISGCLVTIDAMGCQKKIAQKILEKNADYLLAVKGNQGRLEQAFDNYFDMSMLQKHDGDSYSTQEKSRGRQETRLALVNEDLSVLGDLEFDWPLVTTAANEHDLNQLGNLLHGEEQFVSADAGYQGAPQREELAEVDVDWLIAERPGKVRTLKQHPRKNKTAINIEYMKASIRARVEHPFRIIKRQFGFVKARYKGLLKNDNQLAMLFTLANLFRADQMIRQWERSH